MMLEPLREDPDAVGAAPEDDVEADRVAQLRGLAITVCPKVTAVFSMVGSACLIYLTLRDLIHHARLSTHEQQRNTSGRSAPQHRSRHSSAHTEAGAGGTKRVLTNPTYARFVLGLSLGDFIASTAWFLTTWPIPKETPEIYGVRLYRIGSRFASHLFWVFLFVCFCFVFSFLV